MHFRQLLKLYVIDIHGRDAGLRMDFCRAKKTGHLEGAGEKRF